MSALDVLPPDDQSITYADVFSDIQHYVHAMEGSFQLSEAALIHAVESDVAQQLDMLLRGIEDSLRMIDLESTQIQTHVFECRHAMLMTLRAVQKQLQLQQFERQQHLQGINALVQKLVEISPEYDDDEQIAEAIVPMTPDTHSNGNSMILMTPQSSRNKTVIVISDSAMKEIKALKKVRKVLMEELDRTVQTHRRARIIRDIQSIDDEIERIHRQFRDQSYMQVETPKFKPGSGQQAPMSISTGPSSAASSAGTARPRPHTATETSMSQMIAQEQHDHGQLLKALQYGSFMDDSDEMLCTLDAEMPFGTGSTKRLDFDFEGGASQTPVKPLSDDYDEFNTINTLDTELFESMIEDERAANLSVHLAQEANSSPLTSRLLTKNMLEQSPPSDNEPLTRKDLVDDDAYSTAASAASIPFATVAPVVAPQPAPQPTPKQAAPSSAIKKQPQKSTSTPKTSAAKPKRSASPSPRTQQKPAVPTTAGTSQQPILKGNRPLTPSTAATANASNRQAPASGQKRKTLADVNPKQKLSSPRQQQQSEGILPNHVGLRSSLQFAVPLQENLKEQFQQQIAQKQQKKSAISALQDSDQLQLSPIKWVKGQPSTEREHSALQARAMDDSHLGSSNLSHHENSVVEEVAFIDSVSSVIQQRQSRPI